jgi:hypothetical protein
MPRAIRRHHTDTRATERLPLHAPLHVRTVDGKPAAPLARCTEIGLGGLRVSAAEGLAPGERVHVALRLPSGRIFAVDGVVAWSRQTLHLAIFGSPEGMDDDAAFGVAFAPNDADDLLPIARLFAARDGELRKARRIRRMHGLPFDA